MYSYMLYNMSKQKLREIDLKKYKAFQNPSQICRIKSFANHIPLTIFNLRSLFNDLTNLLEIQHMMKGNLKKVK